MNFECLNNLQKVFLINVEVETNFIQRLRSFDHDIHQIISLYQFVLNSLFSFILFRWAPRIGLYYTTKMNN